MTNAQEEQRRKRRHKTRGPSAITPRSETEKASKLLECDVFLSFNEKDRHDADRISKLLRRLNLRVLCSSEPDNKGCESEPLFEATIIEVKTAVVIVGLHGVSDSQAESDKLLLQKSNKQKLSVIAVLLPGASKDELPDWFKYDAIVGFSQHIRGLGAVARLYAAITAKERIQVRWELDPDLRRLAEKSRVPARLAIMANDIGRDRKLREIDAWVSYLRDHPEKVHSSVWSSVDEEIADWCAAEHFFASDVLRGTVNMARQFSIKSYRYLEQVWLDDVKRLRAYMNWKKQEGEDKGDPSERYMIACRELNEMVFNPHIKAGIADFLPIAEYIGDSLLRNGVLDPHKPAADALIRKKARCIWRCTGKADTRPERNWQAARSFVADYYENIVPAVEEQSASHIVAVMDALSAGKDEGYRFHIVNCFEASLLIFFLDPKETRHALRGKRESMECVL
jgi:hypothetical protein